MFCIFKFVYCKRILYDCIEMFLVHGKTGMEINSNTLATSCNKMLHNHVNQSFLTLAGNKHATSPRSKTFYFLIFHLQCICKLLKVYIKAILGAVIRPSVIYSKYFWYWWPPVIQYNKTVRFLVMFERIFKCTIFEVSCT